MQKRILSVVLVALLLWPMGFAMAGEISLAQGRQAEALAQGFALRDTVTFAWGGLPLLDDGTNRMLKSLLKATTLQRTRANGYLTLDALLQDVSVLDLVFQVQDGMYYESSNLLGGDELRFTPASFSAFVSRLSARSEGVLPPDLDPLFRVITQVLSGSDMVPAATGLLDEWAGKALVASSRQRPKLFIPGLYGTHAMVRDITREEALDFARAYADLLAENNALTTDSTLALGDTAQQMAETLRTLPAVLEDALPADIPPTELRDVYDADNALIARQIEITLPGSMHLYAEWTPANSGVQALYISVALDAFSATALITREEGVPYTAGSTTRRQNRTLAEIALNVAGAASEIVITRTENSELRAGRESVIIKTDWMMQDEALFGQDAVVTLTAQTTQTTSGERLKDYLCRAETIWRVKGLGFDSHDVLTISTRTIAEAAIPPIDPANEAIIDPTQMDDATLDAWLTEISEVYLMQCVYTILGRLPSDVAAYLLERIAF